jgi:hypothetical protein
MHLAVCILPDKHLLGQIDAPGLPRMCQLLEGFLCGQKRGRVAETVIMMRTIGMVRRPPETVEITLGRKPGIEELCTERVSTELDLC